MADATATQVDEDLDAFLTPGTYVNSDHPAVIAYAREVTKDAHTDRERAVALYYAVRDDIRYDPYVAVADPELYYASRCLDDRRGFCIPKAVLLAACARGVGIPSRVAFADVRNHLCTPRLRELMGTDVFTNHGFTELWLGGRWVKATPHGICQRQRRACRRAGRHAACEDARNLRRGRQRAAYRCRRLRARGGTRRRRLTATTSPNATMQIR
jgi:transglutaminase-like putative cysteine protease